MEEFPQLCQSHIYVNSQLERNPTAAYLQQADAESIHSALIECLKKEKSSGGKDRGDGI